MYPDERQRSCEKRLYLARQAGSAVGNYTVDSAGGDPMYFANVRTRRGRTEKNAPERS